MKKTYITGFFVLVFGIVSAQETLSLSEAIQIGLQRNYDIRIERENVTIAERNNSWGEAGLWPTVNLEIGQNNSLTDNVRTATPFQLQDITLSNSFRPGVTLNWNLFNGFKVNMSKRRLEQLQAESNGNASIVIANTIQAIILGYYNVILQEQALNELEKQLQLSKDKYDYLKIKSDLGSAVISDLLIEEGNYLSDSLSYIEQQLQLRIARRELNELLAEEDLQKSYVFTTDLEDEVYDYKLEDLRDKLFNRNIDLQKQYITQSILNTNVRTARADRYPALRLNAGFAETRSRVDLSNASFPSNDGSFTPGPADPLNAVTDNYFANFTISYTLFNGGKINRAIKNAMAQEDIGAIRVEKLKTSLDNDLLDEYDRYNIRKQVFLINKKREESAKLNLEISEEKYKNGTINSFDFRVVQNNYLSAAILRLRATYSLISSHVALMRLTGGLIEEYN